MSQQHQVTIASPALDAYLRQVPAEQTRPVDPEEARARLALALSPDQEPVEWPPDDLHPARVMVCWRLARAFAVVVGLCSEDEPLDTATQATPSPWTSPTLPKISPEQQRMVRLGLAGDLHGLFREGLSLLPPRDQAEQATRWCAAAARLALDLGVRNSAAGRDGLIGLLDPRACALAGVTEEQVLALEELLVDESQRILIESGERAAIGHFRTKYGFARKEAIGLIRLARADALATGSCSVEEDRAIMVANLKDLAARCKEEMNSDKELRVLKELARVQGLTRSEPEDMARSFLQMVSYVAKRQDAKVIDMMPSTYIPIAAPVVEPAEKSQDEDDAEALQTYDMEHR